VTAGYEHTCTLKQYFKEKVTHDQSQSQNESQNENESNSLSSLVNLDIADDVMHSRLDCNGWNEAGQTNVPQHINSLPATEPQAVANVNAGYEHTCALLYN